MFSSCSTAGLWVRMVRGPGVGTLGPSMGEEPHDVSEVGKRFIVTRVRSYPCGGGPDIRRLHGAGGRVMSMQNGTTTSFFEGVRLIDPEAGIDEVTNLLVGPDGVVRNPSEVPGDARHVDGAGLWALPGLVDIQVHFRQPGFEYKETIASGSAAALAGGICTVVVMPNTQPRLDTPDQVSFEAEEARRVRGIDLLVAAASTKNLDGAELTDHAALKAAGAVAITDDGFPVLDDDLMRGSLEQCAELDLLFMQHAEDIRRHQHAPMTDSPVSVALGVKGQSSDAEGVIVERDIALARETGARYHVLHTSTARSMAAIRAAKAEGLPVTCEVSPHHLLLTYDACASEIPTPR